MKKFAHAALLSLLATFALAQDTPAPDGLVWLRAKGDLEQARAALRPALRDQGTVEASDEPGLVLVRHLASVSPRTLVERAQEAGVVLESAGTQLRLADARVTARAWLHPPGTAPEHSEARKQRVATIDVRVASPDGSSPDFPSSVTLDALPARTREDSWSGITRELEAGRRVFELVLDDATPKDLTVTLQVAIRGRPPLRLAVPLLGP